MNLCKIHSRLSLNYIEIFIILIFYTQFIRIEWSTCRKLTKEDIKTRKLPNQISGLVVTKIGNTSPLLKLIEANSVIVEAQKIKVKSAKDLEKIVKDVLKSNQKTILLAIYNNQNQRRYIGVKLD